ncbi:uncharacterized protein LOC116120499 [Pistacia vera]|uniref:uncharacterized protein LOC116120499 n=1 Tax=Pistacia vera TaxID=55513 RepID=UPI0012639E32|nr:uncharacterized protein LOC116120499 [Pistacia vera]
MECTDDQKLQFATFLLKGKARHWWRLVQPRYGDPTTITWANFRQEFFDHYFPMVYQDAKQKMREQNVGEEGLRGRIRTIVASHYCSEFGKLTEIAMRVESNLRDFDKREPQRPKRSNREWTVGGPSNRNQKRDDSFSETSSSSRQMQRQAQSQHSVDNSNWNMRTQDNRYQSGGASGSQRSPCNSCGRFHLGQCQKGASRCYHCGQFGHIKRNCPILAQCDNASVQQNFKGNKGQFLGQQKSQVQKA